MNTLILAAVIIALLVVVFLRRSAGGGLVKHYNSGEILSQLERKAPILLLDIRTADEHRGGYIKGSVHIPLHELRERMEELSPHRQKEIICYCRSGSRSRTAVAMLNREGFSAANLQGGIQGWPEPSFIRREA